GERARLSNLSRLLDRMEGTSMHFWKPELRDADRAMIAQVEGRPCVLMRSAVGDVVAACGADLAEVLLEECRAVAVAAGSPPHEESLRSALGRPTDADTAETASMLGDIERRGRTEADHILADLLRRRGGATELDRSLLRAAYVAVRAAEAREGRERSGGLA